MAISTSIRLIGMFVIIFVALLQGPVASSAPQSNIVMLFLDAKSGKPLTGVQVQISMRNSEAPHRELDEKVVNAKTDKHGNVVIHLQEPIANYLSFRSPNELHECSDQEFSIADVIQSGIVAKYHEKCGQLEFTRTAKPREIIVFDRKYRFLD